MRVVKQKRKKRNLRSTSMSGFYLFCTCIYELFMIMRLRSFFFFFWFYVACVMSKYSKNMWRQSYNKSILTDASHDFCTWFSSFSFMIVITIIIIMIAINMRTHINGMNKINLIEQGGTILQKHWNVENVDHRFI